MAKQTMVEVLNLVISGIPSIPKTENGYHQMFTSFKPCYKWNTFNTAYMSEYICKVINVLNLVISGIPSIHHFTISLLNTFDSFKPCYKWNTFNTYKDVKIHQKIKKSFKPCYKWNTFNTWLKN